MTDWPIVTVYETSTGTCFVNEDIRRGWTAKPGPHYLIPKDKVREATVAEVWCWAMDGELDGPERVLLIGEDIDGPA